MSRAQCEICGETKLDGWTYCPACGHPYPEPDHDDDDDDRDDEWDDDPDEEDDDDDDGALDD